MNRRENAVVRLCADGIAAESVGRLEDAHAAYERAWQQRVDDWDACVAAHYLARHQPSLALSLHWNQEALRYADAITDNRAADFRPSLLLNLGYCYELLGDATSAQHHYQQALAAVAYLPRGAYRNMLAHSLVSKLECLASPDSIP
jgi:tetratricopeptide (TPR) repeat protein